MRPAERLRDPNELPDPVDPRQPSLLGATWTVGSLKYLAKAAAASSPITKQPAGGAL